MSVKLMSLVWDAFPGNGSELLCMLALADWANDDGGSLHPSMAAIAQKIRLSEKQARRIVRQFEADGWLAVVGNAHGGAPWATKQYRLNVARLKALAHQATARETAPADATPPAGVHTAPADDSPPMPVTPPADGIPPLPPVGCHPSHGCQGTPPTGGSQTISKPPMNHHRTTKGEAPPKHPDPVRAVAEAPAPPHPTGAETPLQAACRSTWAGYSEAYVERYGTAPVRNGKVLAQVKALVKRLGFDESPQVAAWFVGHPGEFYVERGHDVGCLLADAEKLRTEWATGRVMTAGKARQSDRAGTTMAALAEVLAEQGEMPEQRSGRGSRTSRQAEFEAAANWVPPELRDQRPGRTARKAPPLEDFASKGYGVGGRL